MTEDASDGSKIKKKRKVRAPSCKHHGAGSKLQASSHKRLDKS